MTTIRLATVALLLTGGMAQAEGTQCSDHGAMSRMLAENWGESRQSIALDAGNAVVELYASAETGTWTLTVTQPGGQTCMVASGHAYEILDEPLPVLDEGA
jgi:cation diffusion facilitator CzcD-associated flavoprotein CzcO